MNRENRYLVLKRTDIRSSLTQAQGKMLESLAGMVEEGRSDAGKPQLQCVVIESDWPEYEPVWNMLQRRVDPLLPPSPRQKSAALDLLQHHATVMTYLRDKGTFDLRLSQGNYLLNVKGNCPKSGALLNKVELQELINELQVVCDAMQAPGHTDTGTYS